MEKNIFFDRSMKGIDSTEFEIVERKGIGHPDTLCDDIAEEISKEYSKYCLKNFGYILPHMIDKIGLIGGTSEADFGKGEIKKPIKLLLNGRFSENLGNIEIPFKEIAIKAAKDILKKCIPLLDIERHLIIQDNLHSSRGPGVVFSKSSNNPRKNWYNPDSLDSIMGFNKKILSNDTSTAVGYFPLSSLEKVVLIIEKKLNSPDFKKINPYVGTDIKIMGVRIKNKIFLTCCIPFISKFTPSLDFYRLKKDYLKKLILKDCKNFSDKYKFELFLNTRDDYKKMDIYLTVLGSSIESGDEGLVGRGNRLNGLISFNRSMSLEAFSGKNPVHHIGKIYNALSKKISEEIFEEIRKENTIFLVSQMGRDIKDPWKAIINLSGEENKNERKIVEEIVEKNLKNIECLRKKIIEGEII